MSNKTSGFKRAIGIVLGVITMLVLIALFVVLVMAPIPDIWADKVTASDNAIDQTVSPTQSETYCPAPIGLADTGTYGDSAFQATVGNSEHTSALCGVRLRLQRHCLGDRTKVQFR